MHWDRPVLRGLFQVEVFRFLRERELVTAECMEMIRSWRHSGFDKKCSPGRGLPAGVTESAAAT